MAVTGIQGQTLEVRVVGCNRLKDTEWISRQDPYVSIEYGSSKFLSSICTDGGKNPTFQEKFRIPLVEGLRELNVAVWNSNTFSYDNLIGSGRVQLQKVLSEGFDDTAWTLQSKTSRYAGELCLIMHYANANKPMTGCAPSAPQYYAAPPPPPQYCAPPAPQYWAPPPAAAQCPPAPLYPQVHPPSPYGPYPPQPAAAHPPQPPMYPQVYAPQPATAYPPQGYPPQPYPPQGNPYHAYPSPY